jgi:hypothetical protein
MPTATGLLHSYTAVPVALARGYLRFVSLVALCLACSEPPNGPVEDATYFRAQVNGRNWSPKDPTHVEARLFNDSVLTFQAYLGTPARATEIMHLGALVFALDRLDSIDITASYAGPLTPGDLATFFETDALHRGTLTIDRMDRLSHTIAGRFQFVGKRFDGVTIMVTNGSFRLNYLTPARALSPDYR